MSVKGVEGKVSWGGQRYAGVKEIGFNDRGDFVVSLHTTPPAHDGGPRGRYFTSIPISDAEYRKTRPTQAAYETTSRGLIVYDDWGVAHLIEAPADIVSTLVAEMKEQSVPEASGGAGRGRLDD